MATQPEARNVDAIWQEMKQENSVPSTNVLQIHKNSLCGHTPRVQSKKKTLHKTPSTEPCRRSTSAGDSFSDAVRTNAKTTTSKQTTGHQTVVKGDAKPLVSSPTTSSFNLAREVNRLSDASSSVRKHAALQLERFFLDNNNPNDQSQLDDENIVSQLAKPLFKRFNDPVEKVRDISLRLAMEVMRQPQLNLLDFLPYLMPAIVKRLGSTFDFDEQNQVFSRDRFLHDAFKRGRVEVLEKDLDVMRLKPTEPSEEIRLLFLNLIQVVLTNAFEQKSSSLLHAYIYDVLLILVAAIHDPFHEINIKSCEILVAVSYNMVSVMKHFSVAIVRELRHLLVHRLARVRVACLECIRAVVACPNYDKCKGSGTEAIDDLLGHREENVIPVAAFYASEVRVNLFAKLDQESNPLVRKSFYEMIADWLMNLPDRYDYESKLMPYLLSAVADENDEIAAKALESLEWLGRRYEQENSGDIIEKKQYGVDGNPAYNYNKPLPKPWLTRPSLGSRLFVRSRTRRFLTVLLRELGNWQCPTRQHAARLLKCVIVYSEETITVDVHLICSTLQKCWRQSELLDLQPELEQLAELSGRYVHADTYLGLLLSPIKGELLSTATPPQLRNALEILRCFMQGSLPKTLVAHIPVLLQTLSMEHLSWFECAELKTALHGVVEYIAILLEETGQDAVTASFLARGRLANMEIMSEQLFQLALVSSCEDINNRKKCSSGCRDVLQTLQKLLTLDSVTAVFDRFGPSVLDQLLSRLAQMPRVHWTPQNPLQRALESLLASVSSPVLQTIAAQLGTKLRVLGHAKADSPHSKASVVPLSNNQHPQEDQDQNHTFPQALRKQEQTNEEHPPGHQTHGKLPVQWTTTQEQDRDPRRLRIEQLVEQLLSI